MTAPSNDGELLGFEFDNVVVDTRRRRVSRNGEAIRLGRLTFELLLALAEAAPRVVTHEDIANRLWGGRYVAPKTLRQRVSLLRQALDDNADSPRYVRVVHGQGYRLIPDVRRLTSEARERRANWRAPIAAGLALLALAAVIGTYWRTSDLQNPAATLPESPSIAVLPFDNLSPNPEDALLIAGLHSDLLTQLAKIGDLKLISRASVMEYGDGPRNIREIGNQLAVSAVLEGSVQRSGDLIHVSVRLLDTRTDEHVWAEDYAHELSATNIIGMQHEIATSIAEALDATLSPEEVVRLSEVPTRNTRAYEFYLAGSEYVADPNQYFGEKYGAELAADLLEQATEEDQEYALAWAALARAYSAMYFFEIDPSPARLELAGRAIERASTLAPNAPETHAAQGYYHYFTRRDYAQALEEFERAVQLMPGASGLFATQAFIARRMGDFERSVVEMQRAIELNPRSDELLTQQGLTYEFLRKYEDAEDIYLQLAERWPDSGPADAHWRLAWLAMRRDGDVTRLKQLPGNLALAQHPVGSETETSWFREAWTAAIYERDYSRALQVLHEWDEEAFDWQLNQYVSKDSLLGVTYRLAGRMPEAQMHFRRAYESIQQELLSNPEVARLHVALGEALAGLGRKEDAVDAAFRAMELMPQSRDTLNAPRIRLDAVTRVLVPAEAYDLAIDEFERYLSNPGQWSIEGLLPDPRLSPLRDNLRFESLAQRYSRE